MVVAGRRGPLFPSPPPGGGYRLTVFVFLRLLGSIYFVAFLSLSNQLRPLIGADGLYPARLYLERMRGDEGTFAASVQLPTIFWLDCSDGFMQAAAYVGVALAALVLVGFANVPLLASLWFLYMSFVHIGQLFYGYGWEILLLETGFLALFAVPLLDPRPLQQPLPIAPVIWLLRWLLFRVMFGAGLIKIRGDDCWRDLTCMMFHYETQPLPNPLSWYMHHFPAVVHSAEVLFNHFVELVVPWFLFVRRLCPIAGLFLVAFQILLISSGNLSWLNWLTLTLCVACFDDRWMRFFVPRRMAPSLSPPPRGGDGLGARAVVLGALVLLVAYLSIGPVMNMLSPRQVMNTSFDRLHLVNTYGAFGSIGRTRDEIIIEGTDDEMITESTKWRAYEFKCKPGDVIRRPCVIAPYQYRLDWQIWFAAMSSYQRNPWLVHFVYKLLGNDRGALSLLASNPFPERPPRFVRAVRYRYRFTEPGERSAWWAREWIDEYLPPLERGNPRLQAYLRQHGWTP